MVDQFYNSRIKFELGRVNDRVEEMLRDPEVIRKMRTAVYRGNSAFSIVCDWKKKVASYVS